MGNYTGVNNGNGWVNSPSVATPLNAENLNIMEQGIKDAQRKDNMVQSDTVNDPTRYPSTAVTFALGQEIDDIYNNLTWLDYTYTEGTSCILTSIIARKTLRRARLNGTIHLNSAATVGDTLDIVTLAPNVYPAFQQVFVIFAGIKVVGIILTTNGIVKLRPLTGDLMDGESFSFNIAWDL